jgi:excisionase family DNA binding protein
MDLLSLADASRELGVAHDTLRAQIHRGRLHAVRPGRDWLITRAELDRYRRESKRRDLSNPPT